MTVEMSAMRVNSDKAADISKSKMEIHPRKVGIDYSDLDDPFFYSGNPCISAMWVALSASFPVGEGEFISSTKAFENELEDEKLLADVQTFSQQEAHHSLQHRLINKRFEDLGYDVASLEKFIKNDINNRREKWSTKKRLARTVVAEHVTAVMAHYALTQEDSMEPFPHSLKALLQWHAIEEIEHKSVTFDVYNACVADRALLMRQYYIFSFFEFPFGIYMSCRFLLKEMGVKVTWQHRKQLLVYLFGEKGLISSVKSLYWMFRSKNFHPWDHDDSELVSQWKERLSPYFQH